MKRKVCSQAAYGCIVQAAYRQHAATGSPVATSSSELLSISVDGSLSKSSSSSSEPGEGLQLPPRSNVGGFIALARVARLDVGLHISLQTGPPIE